MKGNQLLSPGKMAFDSSNLLSNDFNSRTVINLSAQKKLANHRTRLMAQSIGGLADVEDNAVGIMSGPSKEDEVNVPTLDSEDKNPVHNFNDANFARLNKDKAKQQLNEKIEYAAGGD